MVENIMNDEDEPSGRLYSIIFPKKYDRFLEAKKQKGVQKRDVILKALDILIDKIEAGTKDNPEGGEHIEIRLAKNEPEKKA